MNPAQSSLLTQLTQKKVAAQQELLTRHRQAYEWLKLKGLTIDDLRAHSAKLLTGATLGGTLLLASPHLPLAGGQSSSQVFTKQQSMQDLIHALQQITQITKLSSDNEAYLSGLVKRLFGISIAFELDGNRIPQSVGSMGLEQHLVRFADDSLAQHATFREAGMAPGLGAFGYFARDGKSQQQVAEEEMYYIVLPTFLIPDWNVDWKNLKKWYEFRKFVVINPENGKAVVAVLGDSGPAVWTGKQFGGSPEVMAALGFYPKATRGTVLVTFLDEATGPVTLGPLKEKGE